MKAFLVTVVIVALFVITMAFGARNNHLVEINYFVAQGEFALSWIVGGVFLSGFVISWLMAFFIIVRQKMAIRGLNKRLKQTETAQS